jgi:hypothetical protein
MSVQIELSEQQAQALQAKAAAEGLTLEQWLQKLAVQEAGVVEPSKPLKTGYGMLAKYGPAPSAEEIDENRREMFGNFAKDF